LARLNCTSQQCDKACNTVAEEELFGEPYANQNMLLALLDTAQELVEPPEYQESAFRLVLKGPRQMQLLDWSIGRIGQSNFQVPLLRSSSGSRYSYMVGILLLWCEHDQWARLGICRWETSDLSVSDMSWSPFDFSTRQGLDWRRGEGILNIYGYI